MNNNQDGKKKSIKKIKPNIFLDIDQTLIAAVRLDNLDDDEDDDD
jgi:hypothetical protein